MLHARSVLPRPDAGGVRNSERIAGEVTGVTQLATDLGVLEDGVHGLCVGCGGSGLEVLDKLAGSEDLAEQAKLLLEGVPRSDLVGGCVRAEEVPGVETSKVLEDSHELVATEGSGHVAQVVRYRRVVDDCVGDHDDDGLVIGIDRWSLKLYRAIMRQYGITTSPVRIQQLLMGAWTAIKDGKWENGDGRDKLSFPRKAGETRMESKKFKVQQ